VGLWRTPLDADTTPKIRGKLHLIPERCKGCGFCVAWCPCEVLALSGRTNSKGYVMPEAIAEEKCLACGLCALLCPDFAIYSVEIVEAGDER